jgi:phosphatidylglycerol:prolipoprotein diacylglycerol transferase
MNGEAFGEQTDIFCKMGLQNANTQYTFGTAEMVFVHPTFLYESLWNFAGFAIAALLTKHKKYDGQIFLIVFGWYGLGRMFIERLRTDSLYIPGTELRISEVLAGLIFVLAAAALIYFAIKKPQKALYYKAPAKKDSQKESSESEVINKIKDGFKKTVEKASAFIKSLTSSEKKSENEKEEKSDSEDSDGSDK